MPKHDVIDKPVVKPVTQNQEQTALQTEEEVSEESQVIVHCTYKSLMWGERIRIWKSTFLYARESSHSSELLYTENIPLYPEWKIMTPGQTAHFTLIFSGLPKSCALFDLVEDIPEPGGFVVKNIKRNETDVYMLKFN